MKINFTKEDMANMKMTSSLLRSNIATGIVSGFVKNVNAVNFEIVPLSKMKSVVTAILVVTNSVLTLWSLTEHDEVINFEC